MTLPFIDRDKAINLVNKKGRYLTIAAFLNFDFKLLT